MKKTRTPPAQRSIVLDDIDRQLLAALQADARTSNVSLAEMVGLQPSSTLERVRQLEEAGVITGYHATIDPRFVERGTLAFVSIRAATPAGETELQEELVALPDVLEVHHVSGDDGLLVKVRTRDAESLARLLSASLRNIRSIQSTRTSVALLTIKETISLPVGAPEPIHAIARKQPRRR